MNIRETPNGFPAWNFAITLALVLTTTALLAFSSPLFAIATKLWFVTQHCFRYDFQDVPRSRDADVPYLRREYREGGRSYVVYALDIPMKVHQRFRILAVKAVTAGPTRERTEQYNIAGRET